MRLAGIKESFNDAEGVSVVIYFQGCERKCLGCYNPDLWDFNGGEAMPEEKLFDILVSNNFNWIDVIVFQGGEPLGQKESLHKIAKWAKDNGKKCWLYTGSLFEEVPKEIKEHIDVIIDGAFMINLKTDMLYRGSSNQRLWRKSKEGNWETNDK